MDITPSSWTASRSLVLATTALLVFGASCTDDPVSVESTTAEISTVDADLERGSRNHLRAFVSQLDSRGVTYEPTQLDVAAFDAIVSSDTERGPGC